jgi:DNA-binding transcriptional LysR family regulator
VVRDAGTAHTTAKPRRCSLKSGALVAVLSDFLPKQFSIDALYPHREHLPAKVRTFIDVVAKNFRQTDWDAIAHEGE